MELLKIANNDNNYDNEETHSCSYVDHFLKCSQEHIHNKSYSQYQHNNVHNHHCLWNIILQNERNNNYTRIETKVPSLSTMLITALDNGKTVAPVIAVMLTVNRSKFSKRESSIMGMETLARV